MALSVPSAALLAVALSATNASALEIPRYDVERACMPSLEWEMSDEGRNRIYNLCIRDEQAAYDLLNLIWGDLSETTQQRCASYLKTERGFTRGYSRVKACAESMLERDQLEKQSPKFRY